MTPRIVGLLLVLSGCAANAAGAAAPADRFALQKNDVVAFVGGESVVQHGETGHLESLLAAAFPGIGVRYRNLAWEGDTVFEQPRDLNFPGIGEHLQRVKATVVFAQFGRPEALGGREQLAEFVTAYEKLCDVIAKQTPRIVLITPVPYEKPRDPNLPDLSTRNADLAAYAAATVELAKRRGLHCVDVFTWMAKATPGEPLTFDGRRATPRAVATEALTIVGGLGVFPASELGTGEAWSRPPVESLRQAVIEKNRLWFDYWRPMNWAFLGGDRTFTQSSRDPNDLTVRIFPRELEKFVPLIEKADSKIDELAKSAGGAK